MKIISQNCRHLSYQLNQNGRSAEIDGVFMGFRQEILDFPKRQ